MTVTGHDPADVLDPTFQVQLTVPAELAVLGPSPLALDGPDLSSTTIEQEAAGRVRTFAIADDPGATGEVSEVNVTVSLGAVVGFGVALGVALGVGTGVGFGRTFGLAVGTGLGFGRTFGLAVGTGLGFGLAVGSTLTTAALGTGSRRSTCRSFGSGRRSVSMQARRG